MNILSVLALDKHVQRAAVIHTDMPCHVYLSMCLASYRRARKRRHPRHVLISYSCFSCLYLGLSVRQHSLADGARWPRGLRRKDQDGLRRDVRRGLRESVDRMARRASAPHPTWWLAFALLHRRHWPSPVPLHAVRTQLDHFARATSGLPKPRGIQWQADPLCRSVGTGPR